MLSSMAEMSFSYLYARFPNPLSISLSALGMSITESGLMTARGGAHRSVSLSKRTTTATIPTPQNRPETRKRKGSKTMIDFAYNLERIRMDGNILYSFDKSFSALEG